MKKEDAEKMLAMTSKNISDITKSIISNLKEDDNFSILAAFSALSSLTSYFDFKLRNIGISHQTIEETKKEAETYIMKMIAEELNVDLQKGEEV